MLKMTRLSDLAERNKDNEVVGVGSNKTLYKSKKLKNAKSKIQMHIKAMGEFIFLTPSAKEVFNQLRQAFIKTLILQHFDPDCHIWIETDASAYAIGRILSQLISDKVTLDTELNFTKSDFG